MEVLWAEPGQKAPGQGSYSPGNPETVNLSHTSCLNTLDVLSELRP